MATTPKSFYQFLNEQIIEIPILQRDYAQGRKGKETLRRTFLTSLKKALDDAISQENTAQPLQLDFVYGATSQETNNNGYQTLQPLDGQQRLTTLWLFHWYIALRAGKLKEAAEIFKHFSYETRISSRSFCQKMCDPQNFDTYLMSIETKKDDNSYSLNHPADFPNLFENNGTTLLDEDNVKSQTIADFISAQTWFYTKWQQDPTIQSMLRMLSGDKEDVVGRNKRRKNKNDLQIDFDNDAIEKIFAYTPKADFVKYWELLTSDDSPIVFYHLPLKKFGLSDDLYVKMNARGKALTPFENFKADLIRYIRNQREKEEKRKQEMFPEELLTATFPWENIVNPRNGVPILLDTSWTNLFWKFRSKKNEIDEAFLTFFNRYFWNELILTDMPLENNQSYIFLNKDNGKLFEDFAPYRYNNGEIPAKFFEELMSVMDRFGELNSAVDVPNQKQFNYRPVYIQKRDKDNKEIQVIEEITLLGRILFFAITKYFKDGAYDKISFDRWIRVVGNLISGVDENGNDQIRSIEQARNVIIKLNTLNSHTIYEDLVKPETFENTPKVIEARFKEEVEKVQQILDENLNGLRSFPNDEFNTWEDAIKYYETFSFFKGSIHFLYRNEDGNPSWSDFLQKSKVAKEYFSKENGIYVDISGDYKKKGNPELLRILYSRADAHAFWKAIWWNYHVFSNKDNSWLHLLNHPLMAKAVHYLLLGDEILSYSKPMSNDFASETLYLLSQTHLLNYVAKNIPDSWIRDYHYHIAIFPSATGIFLNAKFRDDFLQNTNGVKLTSECTVEDTGLLFGSNIDFSYNKCYFRWYDDDKIYLTAGVNSNCVLRDNAGQNDMEKYYVYNAKDTKDKQLIIDNLDRLISEYINH